MSCMHIWLNSLVSTQVISIASKTGSSVSFCLLKLIILEANDNQGLKKMSEENLEVHIDDLFSHSIQSGIF